MPDAFEGSVRAILWLWRGALSSAPHAPGCACFGALVAPPATPAELEEDVLDYLIHRQWPAAAAGVPDLLKGRLTEVGSDDAATFEAFLRGLKGRLALPERDLLLREIAVVLGSFGAKAGIGCR